ncbi:MAG: alcohol dehydrogenase catalytic domain-containing protein, partial [bacterium]|nr:alcohol dehydrogenase catalytic domain-containing protein [bacterium]
MKAFQFFGKQDLRLVELPEPTIGKNDVLLKIKKVGICGTDLHIYNGGMTVPTPIVLGHEFVGDVIAIGNEVINVKVGDRAVAEHVIGCGKCLYCKQGKRNLCKSPTIIGLHTQGALAQYMKIPSELVFLLPQELSYDEGVLVEPLSIAVYAIRNTQIRVGDVVAVVGQGPIGLLVDQVAKTAGATVFGFDRHENRLLFAKEHGYIFQGINIGENNFLDTFKKMISGDGADVVFEAVGSDSSAELALELARATGKVTILGVFEHNIQINMMNIVKKELSVQGSWTCIFSFPQTLLLLKSKAIDTTNFITHRYSFSDTVKAFQDASTSKEGR